MKIVLAAIIVWPCHSVVVADTETNTTIVHACPKTVTMRWEERPENPKDYAKMRHYWSLPRDDRAPIAIAKAEPPKQAKSKKKKRKKKRRRG
jgi:methionine-rich copper-binding protein CopC